MIKVLNLYAGIGGNRKLWGKKVDVDVVAVENNSAIAEVYQKIYPDDTVIVGDALYYLEKHYDEFDFIWSSPPCSSHGQYRHNVGVIGKGFNFSAICFGLILRLKINFLKRLKTASIKKLCCAGTWIACFGKRIG